MFNVQKVSHQTISALALLVSFITLLAIVGGGFYWAGKVDTRIDEQDRRLEIQFNGLEQSIEAVDERIDARIDSSDARISSYGYHHHAEDGAVLFASPP